MIKKMVIVMSVVCIPLLLNGMELLKKKAKHSDEVIEMEQRGGSTNVPQLNLSNVTEPLSRSKTGKASIKSLNQIQTLKTVQSTYRKNTSRGSEREGMLREKSYFHKNQPNMASSSGIVINVENKDTIDIQQPSIKTDLKTSQLLKQLDEEVIGERPLKSARINKKKLASSAIVEDKLPFSEQSMWDLLQRVNPKFYAYAKENYLTLDDVMDCPYDFSNVNSHVLAFAKKYDLPVDEMMEYQHLLDNFDVEPEALVALVQQRHELSDYTAYVLKQYFKKIQDKEQEDYIPYALDFIGKTCFSDEVKDPSPLHKAVVTAQNKEISSQRTKIIYQWLGFAVTIITTLAGAAWGIYGQATGTNPTTAPTMAPTNSPTNMPTFMPTGAPT